MDRRGNVHHFDGGIINITGPLSSLEEFCDKELDFIAGIGIIGADAIEDGKWKIIIQARKHAQPRVIAAAKRFDLVVA